MDISIKLNHNDITASWKEQIESKRIFYFFCLVKQSALIKLE